MHQQPSWVVDPSPYSEQLLAVDGVVRPEEIDDLAALMEQVNRNEMFVLQGGDCAETFRDSTPEHITQRVKALSRLALPVSQIAEKPVLLVGRMAGQYGKPRSADMESIGEFNLPSYRGDAVNRPTFTISSRRADPANLIRAYEMSRKTMDTLRAMREVDWVELYSSSSDILHRHNRRLLAQPTFPIIPSYQSSIPVFVSHEALLLDYEQPLIREIEGKRYSLSGHMLWIGDRTRQLDGPHVQLLRSLSNPIGIKIGPSSTLSGTLDLIDTLAGERDGHLTLIVRMGSNLIDERLPGIVRAVNKTGVPVNWFSDPMHGNTITMNDRKTRKFEDISTETEAFFSILSYEGITPHGVHIEMSGWDVTEVVGGFGNVTHDLDTFYDTVCDPRLNQEQALELSIEIAHLLSHSTQ